VPDSITYTVDVKTADGNPAVDPDVDFTVCSITGAEVLGNTAGSLDGQLAVEVRFEPDAKVFGDLSFSLFRGTRTGIRPLASGEDIEESAVALRNPDKWKPRFRLLNELIGPGFKPFQDVVAKSDSFDLKVEQKPRGPLAAAFDGLGKNDDETLAKMCLLNLYAMLSEERNPVRSFGDNPWFSLVQKIVRLDRERVIAEVDATVYKSVQHILDRLDYFGGVGFFPEPNPSLHLPNFPAHYKIADLVTVKKKCEQGNLQLTVGVSHAEGGVPVYVLDCDMDEHAAFFLHAIDVLLVHPIKGGTNPFDMHEVIMLADSARQMTNVSALDLGYELEPK